MDSQNSPTPIQKTHTGQLRAEAIRPFVNKYQYHQLSLPEPSPNEVKAGQKALVTRPVEAEAKE